MKVRFLHYTLEQERVTEQYQENMEVTIPLFSIVKKENIDLNSHVVSLK